MQRVTFGFRSVFCEAVGAVVVHGTDVDLLERDGAMDVSAERRWGGGGARRWKGRCLGVWRELNDVCGVVSSVGVLDVWVGS